MSRNKTWKNTDEFLWLFDLSSGSKLPPSVKAKSLPQAVFTLKLNQLWVEEEGWTVAEKLPLLQVQTRENSVQKVLLIISSWTNLGPKVVRQIQSSIQNPVQIPPPMTWGTQSVGSWVSRSPSTSTSTVEQSPSWLGLLVIVLLEIESRMTKLSEFSAVKKIQWLILYQHHQTNS